MRDSLISICRYCRKHCRHDLCSQVWMGGKQLRDCSIMQTGHSLRVPSPLLSKTPVGEKDGSAKEAVGKLLLVVDRPVVGVAVAMLVLCERATGVAVMLL